MTFRLAVPVWFVAVGATCLWAPASSATAAAALLGTALLVPPVMLLGADAVACWWSGTPARVRVAAAGNRKQIARTARG
jgi:hypothetical protein